MPAPRKYPQELRERAVRLVQEARVEEPTLSVTAAVARIGTKVGVNPDTLRSRSTSTPAFVRGRPAMTRRRSRNSSVRSGS